MPDMDGFYLTLAFPDAITKKLAAVFAEDGKPPEAPSSDTRAPTETVPDETAGDFEATRTREEKTYDFERTQTKKDKTTYDFVTEAPAEQESDSAEAPVLLEKSGFLGAAKEALDTARAMGKELEMTLLDIPQTEAVRNRLGEDLWHQFTDSLTELLAQKSIDGQTAAQITQGRYTLIHDKTVTADSLRDQIAEFSKGADPEGEGFAVESKTVTADLESLSDRETTKALIYTINEFERKGTSLTIDTLNSSFKTYMAANAQKMSQFKSMIEQLNFDLHYQPIVALETLELAHYEVLTRFKGEISTQEWVVFGEDIGLAADFDIAVCERVINYLLYKAAGSRTKYAVNISGQSIQNEQFFRTLMAKLTLNKQLAERMIFEITESTTIEQLGKVNRFIRQLQTEGYKICLDDFGAGSASFQYLHQLDVDYVKIDGQYTKKITHSDRDRVMVQNLAKMCRDLNITVVAEMVETEEQFHLLREMEIPLGQGYLFGKAGPWPDYDSKKVLLSGK
ncbi:MAG: EAL domain-containing protein [Alphaproteobacteria bacterium]|nr:EAL domain-containing protein [Alphaproteobacteria bacterium]